MKRHASNAIVLGAAWLTLQSCQEPRLPHELSSGNVRSASVMGTESAGRYLVVFGAEHVPAGFGQRIAGLGGAVEAALDGIGVATVTGLSERAAAELAAQSDVRNVEPDIVTTGRDDADAVDASAVPADEPLAVADATASPTLATFYARQWNMRAVFAPEAWAAGFLGSRDVVVAILDTGIDYLNSDLVGLVDLDRSISLVPEDVTQHYPGRLPFSDLFWHGTAVTSVLASNATILAGVNRHVTLLAVKIADSTFATTLGRILAGIVYAADHGADVINISNALDADKDESPGIVAAAERAVSYAFQKGALIVAGGPGNDSVNLDHNGARVRLPCEAANALCVAATGPTGAAGVNGPWQNVDAPASYSGFGRSAISVAAPGGTGEAGQFRRVWVLCTTTPTATTGAPACRRRETLAQGRGVSFAGPLVAGLAALLVAQLGHGNPALIRARILASADDLGEPGLDPHYGQGRINIARALGVVQ